MYDGVPPRPLFGLERPGRTIAFAVIIALFAGLIGAAALGGLL